MLTALIALGLGLVIVVWVVGIYNGLVTARNRYKNGYAQIDVQLRRRYDLIPNLVETAKGYMKHERDALEAVVAARNQASNDAVTAYNTSREKVPGSLLAGPFGFAPAELLAATEVPEQRLAPRVAF
jgi:LemA protein